jgi:D-alanine-D-alanine ligase-like ATP-grasp enzyme
MNNNKKKLNLLIVEPGFQVYKEHIVKGIHQSNEFNIYIASGLVQTVPTEWTHSYSNGFFAFSYKEDDLLEKCLDFMLENDIVFSGALTLVDTSVHFVNELQHALGIPTISKLLGKSIKNKGIVRNLLSGSSVNQPIFRVVQGQVEISDEYTNPIGYPIIVKPTEMMSSLGVRKVDDFDSLCQAHRTALSADFWNENLRESYGDIHEETLLEEYIEGDEYSVETIVFDGKPHILGVTQKFTTTGEQFDEVGHVFPAKVNIELMARIRSLVTVSHKILKFDFTATHTEFRVRDGIPYLIEINCRTGGDLISRIMELSSGSNYGQLLARVHCGQTIDECIASFRPKEIFAVQYISTALDGIVSEVPDQGSEENSSIVSHVAPGDILFRKNLTSVSRLAHRIFKVESREHGLPAEISPQEAGFSINPLIFAGQTPDKQEFIGYKARISS